MYLHCGHEFPGTNPTHWLLNTSYAHYLHHAVAGRKCRNFGWLLSVWDRWSGCAYGVHEQCPPAALCRERGGREEWMMPDIPNYGIYLLPVLSVIIQCQNLPLILEKTT